MKNLNLILTITLSAVTTVAANAQQRPVVQTKFTADPAPIVVNDRVYLFTSHDADDTPEGNANFKMEDWLLYSSSDLVNWQEYGSVADLTAFEWLTEEEQKNGAWAIQVIERNGKYYMYAPIHLHGIGVLVSDSLYGPWTDPLGKPLVDFQYDSIDPTVLIDDDGSAYLYWGNPNLWYAKLNDDMVSFEGEPIKDATIRTDSPEAEEFGYQEGPWAYKREGKYYMAYASTCCPEGIGWAWSDKPFDNWEYGGEIMAHDRRSNGNHPGIFDFKGKSYCFGFNYYLNWKITDKHHERRSVCLMELHFNDDGSIEQCPFWDDAEPIAPVATFCPYGRVEAETMAWSEGVKSRCEKAGIEKPKAWQDPCIYLTDIDDGDYIVIRNADFGDKDMKLIRVRLRRGAGEIEVRLDSTDGETVATLAFDDIADDWVTLETDCSALKGIHDLVFVFHGGGYEIDWWEGCEETDLNIDK